MAFVKYTDNTTSDVEILNESIETIKATTYNYDRYFSGLEITREYENVPDSEHKYGFSHEQKRYNIYECFNNSTTAGKMYGVKTLDEFKKPPVDLVYAWFNPDNGKSYFKSGNTIKYIPSGSTVGSSTINYVKLNPQKHYIKLNNFYLAKKHEPDTETSIRVPPFDTTVTGLKGFETVKDDYYCSNFSFSIVDITNNKTLKNVLPVLKINNPIDDSILYSAFPYVAPFYISWQSYSTSSSSTSAYTYMYSSSSQTERFSFNNNYLGGNIGNYPRVDSIRYWTEGNFKDIISCMPHRDSSSQYVRYEVYFTYEEIIKQIAHLGLFVIDTDNTVYCSEVLQDGQTTGVLLTGADMEKSYIFDKTTQTTVTEYHPEHCEPETDEDITEKMNIGGFYSIGGMVNYYSLVNTPEYRPLDLLSENLSNWDYVDTGKDVLRNLISLKAFPIPRENLCRGTSKEIIIAGTETGVNGQTIDSIYEAINFGTVNIPHRYNDFRDYAPYTKIELCIPFCGWIELPSHCMGRNVTVRMTYDIVAGTCKAYCILDDNTIVAEISGVCSMDIPFTADAVGVKSANVINGVLGVATSVLGVGAGIATGNALGTASGVIGAINSVTQTVCANNANYTEVKGNTGDCNNFFGVKKCYLKVTYPISHVPDGYNKSIGYVYNRDTTLTQGMGFTKINNPVISGNMTNTENDMIKNLLTTGVIL